MPSSNSTLRRNMTDARTALKRQEASVRRLEERIDMGAALLSERNDTINQLHIELQGLKSLVASLRTQSAEREKHAVALHLRLEAAEARAEAVRRSEARTTKTAVERLDTIRSLRSLMAAMALQLAEELQSHEIPVAQVWRGMDTPDAS